MSDDLPGLQAEYPAYKIWQEQLPSGSRYIARSLHQGLNPHTVVTPDLGELRNALQPGAAPDAASHLPPAPPRPPVTSLTEPERSATSTPAVHGRSSSQ